MKPPRAAVVLAAVLALPASASAQTTTTPAPTTPPPAAEPADGTMRLVAERVGSSKAVLAGTRIRVRGTVEPYVAGQTAVVRVYRGTKKVFTKQVAIQRSSTGKSGFFVVGYTAGKPGRIVIRASHRQTPQLETLTASAGGVDVITGSARPGDRGQVVRLLQAKLDKLGYVVGQRGFYDDRTARAVIAFRKVTGMARTNVAGPEVFRALAAGKGAFKVRFPNHGRHIEGDISRQVMALIGEGGKVERIYHISSGAPATPTILGTFRVYRKDLGTNALGMVHSSYFIRGYAIHGYKSVPTYNASHGCLRVPVPDALSIYNWVRMGTIVDTYR